MVKIPFGKKSVVFLDDPAEIFNSVKMLAKAGGALPGSKRSYRNEWNSFYYEYDEGAGEEDELAWVEKKHGGAMQLMLGKSKQSGDVRVIVYTPGEWRKRL